MALIEFQNNTAPYLNADNLNNNFNYLDEKTLDTYLTNETIVGKWINNKPLYRKVIDIGNLPNATTKTINHNISNLDTITKIYGVAKSSNASVPLPYFYPDSIYVNYGIGIEEHNNTAIDVITGTDRSSFTGYIILEYTKITD